MERKNLNYLMDHILYQTFNLILNMSCTNVLYTLVHNKLFCQLIHLSLKNFIFLKTFNPEFPYIEVWFTDQNSKTLEIEHKINITLVIN